MHIFATLSDEGLELATICSINDIGPDITRLFQEPQITLNRPAAATEGLHQITGHLEGIVEPSGLSGAKGRTGQGSGGRLRRPKWTGCLSLQE